MFYHISFLVFPGFYPEHWPLYKPIRALALLHYCVTTSDWKKGTDGGAEGVTKWCHSEIDTWWTSHVLIELHLLPAPLLVTQLWLLSWITVLPSCFCMDAHIHFKQLLMGLWPVPLNYLQYFLNNSRFILSWVQIIAMFFLYPIFNLSYFESTLLKLKNKLFFIIYEEEIVKCTVYRNIRTIH